MTSKTFKERYIAHENDWWLLIFGAMIANSQFREHVMGKFNWNLASDKHREMFNAIISRNDVAMREWLLDNCGVISIAPEKPMQSVMNSIADLLSLQAMLNGHGNLINAMTKGPREYLAALRTQVERCEKYIPEEPEADPGAEKAA